MLVIEQSQGVCVGSLCGFAPKMEPITSKEYGFSPSPSTASPLHCFKIHSSALSTQTKYFFRVWPLPSAVRFSELSGFSELWVLERWVFAVQTSNLPLLFFLLFFRTCWILNSGLSSSPTWLYNFISILPSPWIDLMTIKWTPYNLPLITYPSL